MVHDDPGSEYLNSYSLFNTDDAIHDENCVYAAKYNDTIGTLNICENKMVNIQGCKSHF